MPVKGLSMRYQDAATWSQTERLALQHGFHVSRLVAALLYQYCCELGSAPDLRPGASRLARNGEGVLVPAEVPEDVPGSSLPSAESQPAAREREVRTMTVRGLAEASGQSVSTIQRHVDNGRIPAYRSGGTLLIDVQDVTAYLEKRRIEQAVEWGAINLWAD